MGNLRGPGAVAPRAESETGRDAIISLTSQRRQACDNCLTVIAKVKVGACSMLDDVRCVLRLCRAAEGWKDGAKGNRTRASYVS